MPTSEKTDKAGTSWSTHDNACSHCRERKIRCGRERPRCANCKRDGVDCEYSNPAKRVNHIKLLCNNVGGVEGRLSNIESELSVLNNFLRANGTPRPSNNSTIDDNCSADLSPDDLVHEDIPSLPQSDRHIVRSSSNLTDRYHGPCTLLAVCNDFCDALLSRDRAETPNSTKDESPGRKENNKPAIHDAAKDFLKQICFQAGFEEPVDFQVDPIPIRLPPKQLLLMAHTQFFQQVGYTTDIFVQSSFWSNVESVYSRTFTPADEAWAICYNTIILLVLGPESPTQDCNSLIGSHFIRPFLLTVRSALGNPQVLMAAKMVNVQALALLSIAAQMYYPLGVADSIFAQACVLARTMGLHQARSVREGSTPQEAQERLKVFTSLYLRDKSYSMLRGSICWLPSFDCSLSSELAESSPADSSFAIRNQLARLQDECYRLIHSGEASKRSSAKSKNALLRIEQGLEHWANTTGLFSSQPDGNRNVDLRLEFLATRICVFRKSPEPSHIRQAIHDSRASCLLLAISYGKHESFMVEQLDELLLSKTPSKSLGRGASGRSSRSSKAPLPEPALWDTPENAPSRLHSLLDPFPVPAFFSLAINVIWPSPVYDESKAEEDLDLLQRACSCYKEFDVKTQADNHTRKVGRTLNSLLEVIKIVRGSEHSQPLNNRMQQSNNALGTPSTSNPYGEHHGFSESISLPSPSAPSVPPMFWENLLNPKVSTTMAGSPSSGASPELITAPDAQFQPFDPFRQNLCFPSTQRQPMPPPSSQRQQMSDLDTSMDFYPDSRLFFDFPSTNSSMAF